MTVIRMNYRFIRYFFARIELFLSHGMKQGMKHDLKSLITKSEPFLAPLPSQGVSPDTPNNYLRAFRKPSIFETQKAVKTGEIRVVFAHLPKSAKDSLA